MRRPPRSTLVPYTTLFRSRPASDTLGTLGGTGTLAPSATCVRKSRSRSEEHTSELQSRGHLVCRLLLERCVGHRDLHSFPTRRSSDLDRPPTPWALSAGRVPLHLLPPACGSRVRDRKSTRLNSSHVAISYAVFCLKDASATEIYTRSLHDALPISTGLRHLGHSRRDGYPCTFCHLRAEVAF